MTAKPSEELVFSVSETTATPLDAVEIAQLHQTQCDSKVEFYREADAASGFREAHLLGSDSERVAATKVETCGDIGSRQMAARTCRTNRLPAPSPSHTELETVGDFATTTFTARQVSRCVRWDIDSMMTSRTTPSWKRYLRFQLRVG